MTAPFRMARLQTISPFVLALAFLAGLVTFLLYQSFELTGGNLVYVQDDPYIHMAIAKNVAHHGVWGVTRYEFGSSSSSPFWTLLLAISFLTLGVNESVPFVLALASAVLALGIVWWMCAELKIGFMGTTLVLLGLVLVTPLPTLIFLGLEHALHLALSLLFAFLTVRIISTTAPRQTRRPELLLYAITPLMLMTRYESMFLIACAVVLFGVRKRWTNALLLVAVTALSLLAYGIFSVSNGWDWVPAPLLLKSGLARVLGVVSTDPFSLEMVGRTLGTWSSVWDRQLQEAPVLAWLLGFAVIMLVVNRRVRSMSLTTPLLLLFIGTTVLHLMFARAGWFYRYEAYLVGLGWVVCAMSVAQFTQTLFPLQGATRKTLALAVLLMLPTAGVLLALAQRAYPAVRFLPQATLNIYEQQYQLGRFVSAYYPGGRIILNDIGAVTFMADVHILDVLGLGSRYTEQRILAHQSFDDEELGEYADATRMEIAILYESLYTDSAGNHLPKQWVRVGQWTIQNNIAVGDAVVSMYAVNPAQAARLKSNLERFAPLLPTGVIQSGAYLH